MSFGPSNDKTIMGLKPYRAFLVRCRKLKCNKKQNTAFCAERWSDKTTLVVPF